MYTPVLLALCIVAALCENMNYTGFTGWHQKVGVKEAERIRKSEDTIRSLEFIVGGSIATLHAHPYLAGLIIDVVGLNHPSACGGSILTDSKVLTAAHCWNDGWYQAWRFTVVLGSPYLYHGGIRTTASAIAPHPQYNTRTLANDIAILYLSQRVPLSDAIQPIMLPFGPLLDYDFTGVWMQASGYGRYSDFSNPTINTMVRNIFLQGISLQQCRSVYGNIVQDSNLCTNGNGGVGICQGDSGGPLALKIDGFDILIGVSSFVARDGCELGFPSAFAKVSSYVDWIRLHL